MTQPLNKPTFFFFGVTTGSSSIMRVFPEWAKYLKLGDVEMRGLDFKVHDEPQRYRKAVEFIKNDPLALGALVTSRKMVVFSACSDLFDVLDRPAVLMQEISSISKKDNKLIGHALDRVNSGRVLNTFLPKNHWRTRKTDAFIMGAGGAGLALSCHLAKKGHGANRPATIIVSDRDEKRLQFMQSIHRKVGIDIPVQYFKIGPLDNFNNWILEELPVCSLIVNATGLGKDAPGSPVDDYIVFPEGAYVWDFNYRGQLRFIQMALEQAENHHLKIEDGWIYFIYGWTSVISEVFNIEIPLSGKKFMALTNIAADFR